MRRRLLSLALLAGLLIAMAPAPASACSCIAPEIERVVEDASAVFIGQQIDQFEDGNGMVLLVEPTEVFRGSVTDPIELHTASDSAACGISFANAGAVGIVAYDSQRGLAVDLCSSSWDPTDIREFFGPDATLAIAETTDTTEPEVTDTSFDDAPIPEDLGLEPAGTDDGSDLTFIIWIVVAIAILGVFAIGARGPKPRTDTPEPREGD